MRELAPTANLRKYSKNFLQFGLFYEGRKDQLPEMKSPTKREQLCAAAHRFNESSLLLPREGSQTCAPQTH